MALLQVGLDHHVCAQHQPFAAQQCTLQCGRIVGHQDGIDRIVVLAIGALQRHRPAASATVLLHRQHAVVLQVVGVERLAIARQVFRTGVHLRAQRAQAACHQVGIGQAADAQRHVVLTRDQIQVVVGEDHLHADLGILGVEFAQQRRDLVDADRVRRGEPQPAARTGMQLADRTSRFAQFAGDTLAVLVIDIAGFGKTQLARGPVQQLRAQARLQLLHLAAHRGLGQAQHIGGGDEAALFHHLDEDQGVVEIVAHRLTPVRGALAR